MVKWEIDFNYEVFERQLFDASYNAFIAIQRDHNAETFYSFAMTSERDFNLVGLAANTEESLQRVAEETLQFYRTENPKTDLYLHEIKTYLRFMVDEYKYSEAQYAHLFDEVNHMLTIRSSQINDLVDYNKQHLHKSGISSIKIFLDNDLTYITAKVMSKLDEHHIFEKTNTRENIRLYLHTIGSKYLDWATASMLNPPDVDDYRHFIKVSKQQDELRKQILARVYNDPKE